MTREAESVALASCRVWRPEGLNRAVEVAAAEPLDRSFPQRLSRSLGICLKRGAAHDVFVDGSWLRFPANSISVRSPGCIWSCASTGPVGFYSIDIEPGALPAGMPGFPMTFLPSSRLPAFGRAAAALENGGSRHEREEALAELVIALDDVIRAEELREVGTTHAVAQARELLASRLSNPPTLAELSAATGVNRFVLLRRFKREIGITPRAYVVALRLDHARNLLARGVPAVEVAVVLGFADQAHFTRAFRRSVGVAPGRYARQVRSVVGWLPAP